LAAVQAVTGRRMTKMAPQVVQAVAGLATRRRALVQAVQAAKATLVVAAGRQRETEQVAVVAVKVGQVA
tara:strand:+ start:1214 stop:1420 length:207 start_codon:yes stop_codon:yes gene_type:complete